MLKKIIAHEVYESGDGGPDSRVIGTTLTYLRGGLEEYEVTFKGRNHTQRAYAYANLLANMDFDREQGGHK